MLYNFFLKFSFLFPKFFSFSFLLTTKIFVNYKQKMYKMLMTTATVGAVGVGLFLLSKARKTKSLEIPSHLLPKNHKDMFCIWLTRTLTRMIPFSARWYTVKGMPFPLPLFFADMLMKSKDKQKPLTVILGNQWRSHCAL